MKRPFVGIAWVGLCLALANGGIDAASRLDFPRLSFGAATITGVAIVNPNPQPAAVTLTAYGADGQPLQGANFNNPVAVMIPPGQQFSNVTAAIFGPGLDPSQAGWLRAESAADNLTGFFLHLNAGITFFDGADLPRAGARIVFSELRVGGGSSTELNIVNPGELQADIQITLVGAQGNPTIQRALPGRGVLRLDVGEAFGLAEVPGNAYVVAMSSQNIEGFEFVRTDGDLLGVNAVPVTDALDTLFFPQLAVRGVFRTQLAVVNYSMTADAILTITAYKPDGTLFSAPQVARNPITRLVRRGQALREDLEDAFGFTGGQTEGWVRVESTAQAINGSLTYSIPSLRSVAAVSSVAQGSTTAIFSHIATTLGFFTGVAALNSGSLAAQVRVVALRPDGTLLGSYSTTLQPGQRISRLISDIIPQADNQAGGLIFVRSDVPIYLTSLFGSVASGVLANIPPQPSPSMFQPDAALSNVSITPRFSIRNPAETQAVQFNGVGTPAWSVNGVVGGNSTVGTIVGSGSSATYTAPAVLPPSSPVTVTAVAGSAAAAASIDLVSRAQNQVAGLGDVRSVAYLGGLQRLFSAEVSAAVGGSSSVHNQVTSNSTILDVTGAMRETVATFPGEEISKMIPFKGADRRDYLLVTARNAGRVYRINPSNKQRVAVGPTLNAPTTLVEDAASGNILVADATGLRTIPRSEINQGLAAAATTQAHRDSVDSSAFTPRLQSAGAASGVSVDRCTGNSYISELNRDPDIEAGAVIREISAATGESRVLTDLSMPGQMLGVYRTGQPCPGSFHLLALDPGEDRVLLLIPSEDLVLEWEDAIPAIDLAFLPNSSQLTNTDSILLAQPPANGVEGSIVRIPLPEVYDDDAENPPLSEFEDIEFFLLEFDDPQLEAAIRDALELFPDEPIVDEDAAEIYDLDASNRGVAELGGIEDVYNIETLNLAANNLSGGINDIGPLEELFYLISLDLTGNEVSDLSPLFDSIDLETLMLAHNQIEDLVPLQELPFLHQLDLSNNPVSDISPLVANQDIESGAVIDLRETNLDVDDCDDILSLRERGVEVILSPGLEEACGG